MMPLNINLTRLEAAGFEPFSLLCYSGIDQSEGSRYRLVALQFRCIY